jgi:large subunit ribosomal protein L4
VLEALDIEEPKTRAMADLLHSIGVEDTVLLVLPASNDVIARSIGNLPWAKVILASNLNLYDIFTHEQLVIARDALDLLEETFGDRSGSREETTATGEPEPTKAERVAEEAEAAEEL